MICRGFAIVGLGTRGAKRRAARQVDHRHAAAADLVFDLERSEGSSAEIRATGLARRLVVDRPVEQPLFDLTGFEQTSHVAA